MRFFARESLACDLLQQAFANADAGNRERAQIQIAPDHDEDDRGDAHDVSAVAADGVRLHALTHVAFENSRQSFAQQRKLERRNAVLARAGCDRGERFGTATESDGDAVGKIRTIGQLRFQQRLDVAAHLLGVLRPNDAGNIQGREQTHGADGYLRVLLDGVVVQDVDLEAAAAEVDDAARRRFWAHDSDGCFAAESRLFGAPDHFERDSGFAFDFAHERLAIARFARGAGRDSAVACDAVFVHDFFEVAERLDT